MNPARQLLEILTPWGAHPFPAANSAFRNKESLDKYVNDLYIAARCLKEISTLLDIAEEQGKDVNAYREGVKKWCQFFIEVQMSSTSFKDGAMLAMTADVIDTWFAQLPATTKAIESQKENLEEQLKDLIQHLLDDSSLDTTLKNHAIAMSKELLRDIQNVDKQGFYDFGESVARLKIYVSAAAERSNDNTFKEFFRKFNEEFLKHPLAGNFFSLGVGFFGGQQSIGQ